MSDEEVSTTKLTARLVGFIAHRPRWALVIGLLFIAAFLPGVARLQADFTYRGLFWSDDPYLLEFERFERRFGNDDAVVVAVHSPSGVFDLETAELLRSLTDGLWKVTEIVRVESLSNFNWVHADGDDITIEPLLPAELTPELLAQRRAVALAHEVLPGYLVSRDGNTALLFAYLQPALEGQSDVNAVLAGVRQLLAENQGSDHVFHVAGAPTTTVAFQEASEHDLGLLVPLLLVVASTALALTLRSVAGVLLPFVVVGLSIVCAFGTAGYLGIPLSTTTLALPNILIAVCVANVVHILSTFYERLDSGLPRFQAAQSALLSNFQATFLTSLTTSVGFFGFASANLKPLSALGMMAGVGTLVEWAESYLVAGSLLFLLPLPRGRRPSPQGDGAWIDGFLDWVRGRRRSVLLATVLLSVGSLWLSLRNDINSDPLKYFKEGYPARVANEFIERHIGGARGVEIVVDTGVEEGIKDPELLRRVDAFQRWLEAQPKVTRALSILDVLKSTHRALNGDDPAMYTLAADRETISQELLMYTLGLPRGMDLNDRVSVKNDALRITVLWTVPTSRETMERIEAITRAAGDFGLNVSVTGKNRLYNSTNEYVVGTFVTSLLTSLLTISLILVVAFRSFSMGMFAMIPNLIPNLLGGAILYFLGQPLDIGTVLVASVALGIAVDDTTHILTNYSRARRQGRSRNEALKQSLQHTARALGATTIILVAGFGVFAFGSFMPNVYFGILTASVLLLGLLVDLALIPAVLMERAVPLAVPAADVAPAAE